MTWLPRPTYQEKKELTRARPSLTSSLRFSEFLFERNILFFPNGVSKVGIAEALVGSFPGLDARDVLADLWAREREGALLIPPDAVVLRGRLKNSLHVQAAMGLCPRGFADSSNPKGVTRLVILLLQPVDRFRIHLRFLVEISSLFKDKNLTQKLLKLKAAGQVIRTLQNAEILAQKPVGFRRFLQALLQR